MLGSFPVAVDDTLHPRVVEIRDPDTQEILGGAVFTDRDEYVIVQPPVLGRLRRFPKAHIDNGPPRFPPWRQETPLYAAVVDALGIEPVGLTGRVWFDLVADEFHVDTGTSWQDPVRLR
jgi:hypothetical protein